MGLKAPKIEAPKTALGSGVVDSKDMPKSSGMKNTKWAQSQDPKIDPKSQGGAIKTFSDSAPCSVTPFSPETNENPKPYKFR